MCSFVTPLFLLYHTEFRDDVKKLQELLHMLRSKIVLDMRDLQTPESQHEVNIDTEPQIRPEFDETRELPQDSDSDSNNNRDELNIDQAEQEGGDSLRMLSILQNEKSKSRSLSSKIGGKFPYRRSHLVGEGPETCDSSISSASRRRGRNADGRLPGAKLAGPRSKRNRENNGETSPAKLLKFLKDSTKKDSNGANSGSKVKEDDAAVVDNLDSELDFVTFDSSLKCHCGKTFANKTGLLSHIRQAHRDPETVRQHQCRYCPMKTTNFGSLKAHILAVHPDKVKHFKCDKCFKKYTNKENWAKHKRECQIVEEKKTTEDVQCPDCKVVLKKGNLNRHQKESCKGRKSKTTLRMYGEALSKVLKDKDPLSDEDNVVLQEVEDDVYVENQQQVNRTAVETNDIDTTVMDVYFCTNCLKKGLTEKEKKEHEEETGHKLDRVKLPNFLQI